MICTACYGMLRGQDGRQWRGTFDLYFDHHNFRWELERSAEIGCSMCRTIRENVKKLEHVDGSLPPEYQGLKNRGRFVCAFLSEIHERQGLYRLDFKLGDQRRLGTFLLKQASNESESRLYTPISTVTSSDEVLELARFWLRTCTSHEHDCCPDDNYHLKNSYYPTRLIDLWAQWSDEVGELRTKEAKELKEKAAKLKAQNAGNKETDLIENTDNGKATIPVKKEDTDYKLRDPKDILDYVRLIIPPSLPKHSPPPSRDDPLPNGQTSSADNDESADTNSLAPGGPNSTRRSPPKVIQPSGLYVTLSHCWGGAIFTRLMGNTLARFQNKIPLNELPRTFREVMHFVRRLNPEIRYIWIDSLCIIQDSHEDWASEAAKMYHVYRNSYCNISATAARNSQEGLYFPRNPHQLWGDEVNINTDGIPRSRTKVEHDQGLGHQPVIRRCDVLDLSFWEREVDKAPVNTRGWVLQERLLPPRVLHFCEHQIAWECRHLDAAERFPHGVPNMELQAGDMEHRSKIKTLIPNPYARHPISTIPSEVSDAAHENWKLVVERYSKTGLTNAGDKLIALAGIAEMMDGQIRGRYVAGMWEKYLASQILWRVEPVWKNGVFSFPSSRPKEYRAPSFSWAAIDAPQGVRCAATVKEGNLHISVEGVEVIYKDKSRFGEVKKEGTCLHLVGVLKRIQMEKRESERGVFKRMDEKGTNTRYVWTGYRDPDQYPENYKKDKDGKPRVNEPWEHEAVYLDSPSDDLEAIEASENQLYCMPARTDSSNSLTCLLLLYLRDDILNESGQYQRVGITIISSYEGGHDAILPKDSVTRRERTVAIDVV